MNLRNSTQPVFGCGTKSTLFFIALTIDDPGDLLPLQTPHHAVAPPLEFAAMQHRLRLVFRS
jgi:hypothetical protein